MTDSVKYLLDESRIPRHWYNIVADLPAPPPPVLHPGTLKPIGPDELAPLFPTPLIMQEVSTEREIEIPAPVRNIYRQWRVTPMYRARRLEKALQTPARIYYKYEGVSPVGSHKLNTAAPQVYYNSLHGIRRLTTETGAGQWGTALSYACALFGIECEVCLAYRGETACRTVAASNADDATQQAIATACAILSQGVTQGLECHRTPPSSLRCSEP